MSFLLLILILLATAYYFIWQYSVKKYSVSFDDLEVGVPYDLIGNHCIVVILDEKGNKILSWRDSRGNFLMGKRRFIKTKKSLIETFKRG